MRLSSVIAPRDREFFDLFEEAGGNILRATGLLEEMLRDFPEMLSKYQRKFRYILIDEYQDTNPVQYQITKLLAAMHEAIDRCEGFRKRVAASPVAVHWMLNPLASLHAMRGDFELADELLLRECPCPPARQRVAGGALDGAAQDVLAGRVHEDGGCVVAAAVPGTDDE